MGLMDIITGGENEKAQAALAAALQDIRGVNTPTANDLQLTPLEQYTATGQLSPALMEAAAAGPSAYNAENLSAVPMSTMQQVLAKEGEIANAQGMTPQEQAAIAESEAAVNRNTAGQRGAIAQDFAGRGVPASLISAALQNATVGQNAGNENRAALDARAAAADRGITALGNQGALAGQMFGQEAGQANTVAAAENALNQFNAANSQQANLANQNVRQTANEYNTTNAQNIANENVTGSHQVQVQNQVEAPQEAASLALQKAAAEAGVGEASAGQHTAAGQQSAGLFSGLLGAGATMGAGAMASPSGVPTGRSTIPYYLQATAPGTGAPPFAEGGEVPEPKVPGIPFVAGGPVPGHAVVPGNDKRNDLIPAKLSPGEFVVPRTAMANPNIRNFLSKNVPTPRPPAPAAHPSDISSVIKALSLLRAGA